MPAVPPLSPPPGTIPLARTLLAREEELADKLDESIRAEAEAYRADDPVPRAALHASTLGNARQVLGFLAGESAPDVSAAAATGRERAAQGVSVADMTRAFRIGFEALWHRLVREAAHREEVSADDLVALSATLWQLAGVYADAAAEAHRATTAERLLVRERERSALVEALFTGVLAERSGLREGARALGLALDGPFVVAVARSVGGGTLPGREALPGIEAALLSAGLRSAWRLLPDEQIGVVGVPGAGAVQALGEALGRVARARIGVSPPYDSLRETPRALWFARLALRGLTREGVARFDDNPLTVVAAAAPEEAGRVARLVLGPVLALGAAERDRLLDTVETWFAAGGSAEAAGRLLYCHPNTVRYRLRKVEALTGRSLSAPQAVAELGLAVRAIRLEATEK
ncbi:MULTISPECIES: PucR family transcriptional regulator [Streptomyces]|uniref:Helix-turn-helix domain-containing protein n=1 Tax=Streptomyces evansiae TaxID=3075535 RepID=A0ABU2QSY4_9ACTN|nr:MULTISPECIES: helix-turn-helix domain-containing protein [unclassified Streptomyces]MDT0407455.1 helix-turn-helix domain-containing protein [Streptomyces sp. DSM 41979]SCD49578.1 PucR C-terminal helix-turn-helix domain-containing protein [Streptomyces sp. DfronAA-171]